MDGTRSGVSERIHGHTFECNYTKRRVCVLLVWGVVWLSRVGQGVVGGWRNGQVVGSHTGFILFCALI